MKDFPKGWKPPKKKFRKAPPPPPGHTHSTPKDYRRSDRHREIDDAMDDGGNVGNAPCALCGKVVRADQELCEGCEAESKVSYCSVCNKLESDCTCDYEYGGEG